MADITKQLRKKFEDYNLLVPLLRGNPRGICIESFVCASCVKKSDLEKPRRSGGQRGGSSGETIRFIGYSHVRGQYEKPYICSRCGKKF